MPKTSKTKWTKEDKVLLEMYFEANPYLTPTGNILKPKFGSFDNTFYKSKFPFFSFVKNIFCSSRGDLRSVGSATKLDQDLVPERA